MSELKAHSMDRLDKAIADVAYIMDTLRAYRDIAESGDCNTCKIKRDCGGCPKPGQLVRYNCMFYVGEGEQCDMK